MDDSVLTTSREFIMPWFVLAICGLIGVVALFCMGGFLQWLDERPWRIGIRAALKKHRTSSKH